MTKKINKNLLRKIINKSMRYADVLRVNSKTIYPDWESIPNELSNEGENKIYWDLENTAWELDMVAYSAKELLFDIDSYLKYFDCLPEHLYDTYIEIINDFERNKVYTQIHMMEYINWLKK